MNDREFEHLTQGTPVEYSREQRLAFDLWLKYFDSTERHDRSVCRVTAADGTAITTTTRERILVMANARERRKELLVAAHENDVDRAVLEGMKTEALDHHLRTGGTK